MIDSQMRRGIEKALVIQKKTAAQVSKDAGCNRNLVTTFLNGNNDIKLMTLQSVCVKV